METGATGRSNGSTMVPTSLVPGDVGFSEAAADTYDGGIQASSATAGLSRPRAEAREVGQCLSPNTDAQEHVGTRGL